MTNIDEYDNPVGAPLGNWTPPALPSSPSVPVSMDGRYVQVVRTDVDTHAPELFDAYTEPSDFSYLPHGPFDDVETFTTWLRKVSATDDPLFHTLLVDGRPVGVATLLRIDPRAGSIEVGYLHFAPALQRTAAATEAMFLMMQRAFALGYRRYEWKCDALNAPSRSAAARLGFSFEGIFRQATIYKDRNRDTAWFSIIDSEWPDLRDEFSRWLDPSNFDAQGNQLTTLQCERSASS